MKRQLMLTENFCDECDEVLHQVFAKGQFFSHKVGALICPKCGHVTMPCNECEDHDACADCPWQNTEAMKAMSDEAYMCYLKANEPKLYRLFKRGDNGDYYGEVIKKIEEV